jgi:selenium metabolism protein YedF
MLELDLRNMSCPQPVVETKRVLEESSERTLSVIVDNAAARDNVRRFAESRGCSVTVEEHPGIFELKILRVLAEGATSGALAGACAGNEAGERALKITAYVNSDYIGEDSQELGRILMRAFLKTLKEITPPINTLVFLNKGVHMAVEGSSFIETLKELESSGVEIHSCGTCLDYFHMMDNVKVGKISNMYDIMTILANSDRVIRP